MEPGSAPWRILETPEPDATPERPAARGGTWWPAIAVAMAAALVAVVAVVLAGDVEPAIDVDGSAGFGDVSAVIGAGASAGASAGARPAAVVVVDVGGAVARPGVYQLPTGARVADAIDAAGGYAPTVDAGLVDRQLNLAAPVSDGQKIRVPVRGDAPAAAEPGHGGDGSGGPGPIDLNRASAEALDTLPGVGPVTASKIIAARDAQPFTSVDDLLARKVVGAATLEKLRPLVTVGP